MRVTLISSTLPKQVDDKVKSNQRCRRGGYVVQTKGSNPLLFSYDHSELDTQAIP